MNTTKTTDMVCPEVKVGDFFVCSWGYDQTNIDFYKVISRTKASVKIQRWTSAIIDTTGYQDAVVPGEEPMVSWYREDWDQPVRRLPAPVKTKRLHVGHSGTPMLTMNSYSNAYLWTGKPAHQTGFGYGH